MDDSGTGIEAQLLALKVYGVVVVSTVAVVHDVWFGPGMAGSHITYIVASNVSEPRPIELESDLPGASVAALGPVSEKNLGGYG
jgi:hypothetical protein